MTEAQWSVSTDLDTMLRLIPELQWYYPPSYMQRKFNLLIRGLGGISELLVKVHSIHSSIMKGVVFEQPPDVPPTVSTKGANIVRDIIGNPWKPVLTEKMANQAIQDHYICEQCAYQQMLYADDPRQCFVCRSHYVRKMRVEDIPDSTILPREVVTRDVQNIANSIYEEDRWQETPYLADALEEAGCQIPVLLYHLRGMEKCLRCQGRGTLPAMVDAGYNNPLMKTPGWQWCYVCHPAGTGQHPGWQRPQIPLEHVSGCWAVDLLRGEREE